jgi:tetratricopeptide (TPR) repeat protein
LVHRRCYASVGGFDETLRACEDWDMWLRITRQFKIIGTNRVLTRHRVLAGSMSSDPTRMIQNRLAVLKKQMGEEPTLRTAANARACKAYGEAYLISAVEYLQYGNEGRAYECLRQGAHLYPALLLQLPTFFELGCGNQPKGDRGNFASLDLRRNAQLLMRLLDKLFQEPAIAPELHQTKRQAYALADFALGLLSYGKGQFASARYYLLHALFTNPKLGSHEQLLSTLARVYLGPHVISWLKKLRHKPSQQVSKAS